MSRFSCLRMAFLCGIVSSIPARKWRQRGASIRTEFQDRRRRSNRCIGLILAWSMALLGCRSRPDVPVEVVDVQLLAHDTSWHASYVLPDSGRTIELFTGREVHVPVNADVRFLLASRDYVSDFTLPELGLRNFAAPGIPTEIQFRADRPGRYLVRGDELCGLPHTEKTRGILVVEDAAAFRAWVARLSREEDQ